MAGNPGIIRVNVDRLGEAGESDQQDTQQRQNPDIRLLR